MTNAELNHLLEVEQQKRLGDLYEDLTVLLNAKTLAALQRHAMARLVQQYGEGNVHWMLDVIREDVKNAENIRA